MVRLSGSISIGVVVGVVRVFVWGIGCNCVSVAGFCVSKVGCGCEPGDGLSVAGEGARLGVVSAGLDVDGVKGVG